MRRLFLDGIATRLATGTTALAGMLLFAGCSASMGGKLETPVLTPAGGTFSSSQTVTVSDVTPGAVLHCTTDGSAPTKSSPVCAQPVTIYKSETLSAVAVAEDGTTSPAVTAAFTISLPAAATPVISPAAGLYTAAQTVTIADTTTGATIYYTTDGSAPTTSSTIYGGPIAVTASETITAVAVSPATTLSAAASAAFTINYPAATPVISPMAGTYTSVQSVTITDATPGATIYYTTDGSMPTTSSPVYSAPIALSATGTFKIQAIAIAMNSSVSATATASFTLNLTAAAPVIAPAGGTFTSSQTVTITDTTPGETIHYSTTGTATANSPTYSAPITLSTSGTTTVSAIAVATGYANSPVTNATFTLNLPPAPTPVISPAGGTFTKSQTVTIADAVSPATIFYTTDGNTPIVGAADTTQYTAPFAVASTETVKAIATAPGYSTSAAATASFIFNQPAAATPVIAPAGGTFTAPPTVTITDTTPGNTIYYTTNGVTPSAIASERYTVPFLLPATGTVQAIAVAPNFNTSAVAVAKFTLNQTAATPVISPNGGTFASTQPVTLTDATAGSTIYYTTDKSTPTVGGSTTTKYTAPFNVAATATVQAIAVATGYANSAVASATFTITSVVGIPLNGTVSSGTKPIVGADVQIYAAGTTGYSSAPKALLATPVVTTSTGSFTLGVTCPAAPGDQVYLVATRGSVGGVANNDIALMTALGSCASLASGASVAVNEVTTIASVYALAAFAKPASGGGIDIGAPAPSAACVSTGKETCNYQGLVNAFKTVGNLVDTGTGKARTITPFYAKAPVANLNTSTVPQARINTLADIVASCVEAAGGCPSLFTAATPPAIAPAVGTAPVDSLQAALNIAQNPGTSVAALYKLIAKTPAYTPILSAAPTDYTMALTFTGAGLSTASGALITNTSMEVDATGGIIVSGYSPNSSSVSSMLAKFDPEGEGLTPATTQTSSRTTTYGGYGVDSNFDFGMPKAVAIDQSGQVWVDNTANLRVFKQSSSSFAPTSINVNAPISVAGNAPSNITIDGQGNAWLANGANLTLVGSTGAKEITSDGSIHSGPSYSFINHVTFASDSSALWSSDKAAGGALYQINPADGTITTDYAQSAAGSTSVKFTPLVADGAGNILGCATSASTLDVYNRIPNKVVTASYPIANGRGCGAGPMIIDGLGHIFAVNFVNIMAYDSSGNLLSNTFPGTLDEFTEKGALISPATDGYVGTTYEEPVVLEKQADGPIGLGIDGSGNLWAVNAQIDLNANVPGGVLVEYVGIAAPVVTPISVALQNKELASRP